MATYRLTATADAEIDAITEYSILNFGLLADHPSWGNDYGHISPGLLRYEHRSHSIYYQPQGGDILILRVLGGKQDPARHF